MKIGRKNKLLKTVDNSINASVEVGFSPWKREKRSKKFYFGLRHYFDRKESNDEGIEDFGTGLYRKSLDYLFQPFIGYQFRRYYLETGLSPVKVHEISIRENLEDNTEFNSTYMFPMFRMGWRF